LGRCNLRCIYCQNYEISHGQDSRPVKARELAMVMLALQAGGAHNVNFVTPTHVVPQIIEALVLAAQEGFRLPLVYNSGGYEKQETLRILEGVFDIYMPDFKYWDPGIAQELSGIRDYPEVARRALKEMHRQVGDLEVKEGLAKRGLLVRHLVLPGNLGGTASILEYLAREVSPGTFVNVMDQYRPAYRAKERPPLDRRPSPGEIREAMEAAKRLSLRGPDHNSATG
jgi:putative pyruvate formate lyase activating enzyme